MGWLQEHRSDWLAHRLVLEDHPLEARLVLRMADLLVEPEPQTAPVDSPLEEHSWERRRCSHNLADQEPSQWTRCRSEQHSPEPHTLAP